MEITNLEYLANVAQTTSPELARIIFRRFLTEREKSFENIYKEETGETYMPSPRPSQVNTQDIDRQRFYRNRIAT